MLYSLKTIRCTLKLLQASRVLLLLFREGILSAYIKRREASHHVFVSTRSQEYVMRSLLSMLLVCPLDLLVNLDRFLYELVH